MGSRKKKDADLATKAYKYRLYPTQSQKEPLTKLLGECCDLYNAALEQRIRTFRSSSTASYMLHAESGEWYKNYSGGKSVTWKEQSAQYTQFWQTETDFPVSHLGRDVLARVDRAYAAFFRRLKENKGKAGFPRFKSKRRYDSFKYPYPNQGWELEQCEGRISLLHLKLSRSEGVYHPVKLRMHRSVIGTVKNLAIKRDSTGKWFAYFSVDHVPEKLESNNAEVGIDMGITHLMALSDGTTIENHKYYQNAQKKLKRLQRAAATQKSNKKGRRQKTKRKTTCKVKGSNRWRKAQKNVALQHEKIANRRKDAQHKLSRQMVNQYGKIYCEDLNIKGLAGGMLAKQVLDASWGTFINMLSYKAADAGREVVKVNPRGTSQVCPRCGCICPKTLKDRVHHCMDCGLKCDRDVASAMEILARGQRASAQAITETVASEVAWENPQHIMRAPVCNTTQIGTSRIAKIQEARYNEASMSVQLSLDSDILSQSVSNN